MVRANDSTRKFLFFIILALECQSGAGVFTQNTDITRKNKLSPREQTNSTNYRVFNISAERSPTSRAHYLCLSAAGVGCLSLNCVDVPSRPKRGAESAALQLQVFCQTRRLCFCKSKARASIFSTFFFFLLL